MPPHRPLRALALVCALATPSALAPSTADAAIRRAGVPSAEPAAATELKASAELAAAATAAGLRTDVLERALEAYERAESEGLARRPVLTVIDYSLPSRTPRLWVLDLAGHRVLAHELVAHGSGTGDDLATSFSNRPGSYQSSLGTFVTGATYRGKHGLSLRLRGLDAGLNDQAAARAIVVHGAAYVDPAIVGQLGRLGRSQGCPALSPAAAPRVIDLIRDGTVVFAYYPSPALERTLGRTLADTVAAR